MQQINSAIEKVSAGLSVPPSLPTPQLPTQRQTEDASALLSLPPPDVVAATSALLQQSLLAPRPTDGAEKQGEGGQVRLGEKQSPSRLALATLDPKLVARALPLPQAELPTLPPPPPHGIQGPAAQREPLSRPPSPKVQVQAESEITLKFWVRPDGVVSRVLPERKGDMALEAAAIRYLEGWRFTPLPLQEPQVEQWGLITVRFLPHAR
jgi:TonB family protein